MILVGFLISQLAISSRIKAVVSPDVLIPPDVAAAGFNLSLFLAFQIGLIVFILCLLIQLVERYRMRPRAIAGKHLRVLTRQGPAFLVFFDPSGKASLLSEAEAGDEAQQEIRLGRWQHFPEGTAVRWSSRPPGDGGKIGDFGLISGCGGSVIYEGYDDHFFGEAEFIAQVHFKSDAAGAPHLQRSVTTSAVEVAAP
jgi:hypothetical protein